MVKIIVEHENISFICKNTRIDNLFPVYNIAADTIFNGEFFVKNINDETVMQVDPVTNSVSIMGKLGVNQELHDIEGMVDIDNLSNSNMKLFVDYFVPLISDTIENMDTFITRNPYDG